MPKIAIVNNEDEIIGAATKSEAREQGLIHRVVRVLLHDGQGNVLLQKRHPKAQDSPNRWDVSVAGHVDEGESYEVAAQREAHEELGLHNSTLRPLFTFYTDKTKGREHIRRFNKVFIGEVKSAAIRPNLTELGGVEWFEQTHVAKMIQENPDDFSAGLSSLYDQTIRYL